MAWGENSYSRLVAWLKIILPLAALALLSTLFLLSRPRDTEVNLPFSDREIEARLQEQRITAPHFTGTTENGDSLSISAGSARPDPDVPGNAQATDLVARIRTNAGARIKIVAGNGSFNADAETVTLSDGLSLITSTGLELATESITLSTSGLFAESAGEVTGTGPMGQFSAGKLVLSSDPDTGQAQLFFTNRIKLVYDPKKHEE